MNSASRGRSALLIMPARIAVAALLCCSGCVATPRPGDAATASAAADGTRLSVETLTPLGTGQRLPPGGYRAELSFHGTPIPAFVKTGATAEYEILVKNTGTATFSAFSVEDGRFAINLTCRTYVSGPDKTVAGGCNRSPLPRDIKPGEALPIRLIIPFNNPPGTYETHIELVHEGVTWFESEGSPSLNATYAIQ